MLNDETFEPQELTVEQVKAAARDYYDRGLLTAQHPNPNMRVCQYRVGDYRCAIGAALDAEAIVRASERGGDVKFIASVFSYGENQSIIRVGGESTLNYLISIQKKHDAWCEAEVDRGQPGRTDWSSHLADQAKSAFLTIIDHHSVAGEKDA